MPVTASQARACAEEALRPGRFCTARADILSFTHSPPGEIPWELFQGRLLDPAHSRRRQAFESWDAHLAGGDPDAPLLSVKFSPAEGRLHVVRGVEVYAHEGYDAGGGVYHSRERRKWTRELIASFDLAEMVREIDLCNELAAALARAVTGVRVPLTPTEAPLPAFSFGEVFYLADPFTPSSAPAGLLERLKSPPLGTPRSRLLEAWLRFVPLSDIEAAAAELAARWDEWGETGATLLPSFRQLFNEISLSPWTDFADKFLALLAGLERAGTLSFEQVLDFEGWLLRQLGRHLTGYDLVTFHHRGANYPDALLLDLLLGDLLTRLGRRPDLFAHEAGRLRRRALRQAWVVRRRYEGWPVPDVPTSPGEDARVYPEAHPRVPEEQILQPARRRRRLFAGGPLTARLTPAVRDALGLSLADLAHPAEQQELGAAVFFDRPFGRAKAPVEPDATPLLASLAYSRSIAAARLALLAADLGLAAPTAPELPGLPTSAVAPPARPGALSLTDAARSAADFVFRHTLPGSVQALRELLFAAGCEGRDPPPSLPGRVLLAPAPPWHALVVYDETYRPRLHIEARLEQGYASRLGLEYPRGGFRVRVE
jgi:hypothetical protein